MLRDRLLGRFPWGWLGEETGAHRVAGAPVWVVDPQDGTAAFRQRLRGAAISIALVREGRPVLGVVYAYAAPDDRGDLFAWAEGCGPLTRNGRTVMRAEWAREEFVVALSHHAVEAPDANAALVAPGRFLAVPSIAWRLVLAAAGEVEAAVSLQHLSAWDVAAGHALLRGAGRVLVDGQGRDIRYRPDGSATVSHCFGGEASVVDVLYARRWSRALSARKVPPPSLPPTRRTADAGRLSRAQGVLLGQVAGDALGALVEFQPVREIARAHPQGLTRLADGGPWSILAGQPTDDSEMALTPARSIIRENGYARDAVRDAYVAWRRSGPFDIGGTTFRAARLAAEDAALTHANPVCRAASAAFAAAIAVGVAGGTRAQMMEAAETHADAEAVRDRLALARREPPSDVMTNMGWVLTALHLAFHYLARGSDSAGAVVATVAMGGDTDTNAAITGALLGAAEGRDAFPVPWRRAVLSCRPARRLGAHQPRGPEVWPVDLFDLAESLLLAGEA